MEIIVTSPTTKKMERVAYLDMLKCLGMFIVVSGHIHTHYGWFSLPLHSYVIPLYFLLSGLTFRRSKYNCFGQFVKRRVKTLLLPYVMLSFVTWLFWVSFNIFTHHQLDYWGPLFQTFIAQGSGNFLVHNVPLWFIPCLFVIEVIYYFIDTLPVKWNVIVCVCLAVLGAWMIEGQFSSFFKLLPWSIEGAFACIIFYCTGNVLTKRFSLKDIQTKVTNSRRFAIIVIIVLTTILIFTAHWNGHISIGSDTLGKNPVVFYLNAFIGIITVFLFSILICSVNFDNKKWKAVMDWHLWFGRNSFYVMATHVPVKGVIMLGLSMIIGKTVKFVGNDLVCCAVVFVITCAISSYLSLLIGKQKKRDEKWVERHFIRKSN